MTSHHYRNNNKNTKMPLYLSTRWTLVVTFLFCCAIFTRSVVGIENDIRSGIISLKLTPHHVELDRRRRERRNLLEKDVIENTKEIKESPRRRDEAMQVGALFEGYGTHYVDLWCGTPPQRQTVIVDTGSGITAFPCSGCQNCGVPEYHIDELFSEKKSSSFETATCSKSADCALARSNCRGNSCTVSMAYAEGSRWDAYEGIDTCYVAGPHEIPMTKGKDFSLEGDDLDPKHAADLSFKMAFGCQTLVTGLFKTQLADGIMGMSNQLSTYWGQMFKAGKMGSDKVFALCFSRPPNPERAGTEAGALTLGGVDTRLHLTPMVWTPAASGGRASFFSVKVRRMMLRKGEFGESALSTDNNPNKGVTVLDITESELNHGGVIVDSGTTDTYWNSGILSEFQKEFTKIGGRAHSNKSMQLTAEEFKAMPTILLQLYSDDVSNSHISDMFHTAGLVGALDQEHKSDVILAIPPSHYFEYDDAKDTYTSRFYPTERGGSVLGANAMMGHDVLFDIDNNRIGWAESACDYTSTVEQNGYEFDITGDLQTEVEKTVTGSSNPAAVAPTGCESYTSGSKCQEAEGCSWYWGKCTKDDGRTTETPPPTSAAAGIHADTPAETPPSLPMNDDIDTETTVNEEGIVSAGLKILEGNEAFVVGILFALSIVCCLIYCCCCRRNSSSGGKYSRASIDPVTIEMTNGNGPIDNHIESFSDEPESDDPEDALSAASKTSSSFRDNPEFDGDFA